MAAWLLLALAIAAGLWMLGRAAPDLSRVRVSGGPRPGAAILGFLALALGMTSPLALHPTRLMLAADAGADAYISLWNFWWLRSALARGFDPLCTRWLFYPNGTGLALHTLNFAQALAAAPAALLLNAVVPATRNDPRISVSLLAALYNLAILGSFTLTGYIGFRLALSETGHRGASLIAGVLLAFTSFRFANLVRLHVLAGEFVVLLTWAWVRWLRRPSVANAALWAGSLVLVGLSSLEYALYAALLLAWLAVPELPRLRRLRSPGVSQLPTGDERRRAAVGGAVLFVLVLLALPFASELRRDLRSAGGFPAGRAEVYSADLADAVVPNPRHPLWYRSASAMTGRFHHGDGGLGASLGWISLALLIPAAVSAMRERRGRRWLFGFFLFYTLSLGPVLHVAGRAFPGLPMPEAILARLLPILGRSRTPIRFLMPAQLCLAVAVAGGWADIRRRLPGASGGPGPEIIACGLILFESLAAPLPLAEATVPAIYQGIRAEPGAFALIHLPALPDRENLLYQTAHRQRLIESVGDAIPFRTRTGPDPFAEPVWNTLARDFGRPGWMASLPADERTRVLDSVGGFLGRYHVRWVVIVGSAELLGRDGRTMVPMPVLAPRTYEAFLDNLQWLRPVSRTESGGNALLEFPAEPIPPGP